MDYDLAVVLLGLAYFALFAIPCWALEADHM